MARRSGRLSDIQARPQKHKRTASSTLNGNAALKKSRKEQTKTAKSKASKDSELKEEFDDVEDGEDDSPSSEDVDGSDFEDEDDAAASDVESEESEDVSDDSSEPRNRRSSGKGKSAAKNSTNVAASDVWKPGVKTGLGPGKQVIIKKPKARAPGKTPYEDETIHPNTLLFLGDLKANNNRQWLKMNDADFRASEKDWHTFVEKMSEKLAEIDDTVPELPVKDVVFRIYRDIRFSKDPTPYKPFFSVAWSRAGRKSSYAHYYLQIGPNDKSFVASQSSAPQSSLPANTQRLLSGSDPYGGILHQRTERLQRYI